MSRMFGKRDVFGQDSDDDFSVSKLKPAKSVAADEELGASASATGRKSQVKRAAAQMSGGVADNDDDDLLDMVTIKRRAKNTASRRKSVSQ